MVELKFNATDKISISDLFRYLRNYEQLEIGGIKYAVETTHDEGHGCTVILREVKIYKGDQQ